MLANKSIGLGGSRYEYRNPLILHGSKAICQYSLIASSEKFPPYALIMVGKPSVENTST